MPRGARCQPFEPAKALAYTAETETAAAAGTVAAACAETLVSHCQGAAGIHPHDHSVDSPERPPLLAATARRVAPHDPEEPEPAR